MRQFWGFAPRDTIPTSALMPGDPARASAVRVLATVLAAVSGGAWWIAAVLHLTVRYPAKAAAAFALALAMSLRHLAGRHPFARFGAANQITAIRAGLVALVVSLVGEPGTAAVAGAAVVLSVMATLLDGADGWVARRTRMTSAFGMRFDMETDAALIQVLAILVWQFGKAGPWVLASGLMRYGFVAAGYVWPWMRRPLAASLRGRTICVVQLGALIAALAPEVAAPASRAIAAVGLSALGYSFFVDTLWLWRTRFAPAAAGAPRTR
jgi:phosphatidylglycerophosphate synthase